MQILSRSRDLQISVTATGTGSPPTPAPRATGLEPSPSQRAAIEAEPGPLLVLAGPGAGKTFCLTERIHYLIEHFHFDPARILAFTFTNKAAGEIAHRLEARLGDAASQITRGTIHAFCAELLRNNSEHAGLQSGFGIADEPYQLSVLRRLEGPRSWHRSTLTRFSRFRFSGDSLRHDDLVLLDRYENYLAQRNVVDFDTLVIKAAELLETSPVAAAIRSRWDVVLVDEFQDLNPLQYRVVAALAREHRHVFAVGDDEQSIYSWAGADPRVFTTFINDFGLNTEKHLHENRRCPQDVFALARRLIMVNTPLFANRVVPRADRLSPFPIRTLSFATDDDEAEWLVEDVRRDREASGHRWGDTALLYRKHDIGDRLEAAFINAGVPCQLPRGRALSDDPVVAYVIAAARVISAPADETFREGFFGALLPASLFDEALARALESGITLHRQLGRMAVQLPRGDESARQIRRALYDWRNLVAVGKQHKTLAALVQELLSRRVGAQRSVLDDRHDEISDPASHAEVVALAAKLRNARDHDSTVWVAPMQGKDIAVKAMLRGIGIKAERGAAPSPSAAAAVTPEDASSLPLPLAVFKAAQLLEMEVLASSFASFTAIDLETTEKDTKVAEIVEIAAVRVRDGVIVDSYHSLVKPEVPISAGAASAHNITAVELVNAPSFAEVWPRFRAFCGSDVVVAHNGYGFDFPVLRRMARQLGGSVKFDLYTFDSLPLASDLFPTSRKLVDLARHFGIDTGQSHRALDDTMALARVMLELSAMKLARARKTALVNLLDQLGVGLALCDPAELGTEGKTLRGLARIFALGPYSSCLENYESEQGDDSSFPTVDEVIEALGGEKLRERLRSVKSADERYPAAMTRLRRLISDLPDGSFGEQLSLFLERVALSQKSEGVEPERDRVNLLTLHSTKGLEFSRVYIVGAEDAQMPGGSPMKEATPLEVEEARRLLYVGITRTVDRLTLTHSVSRHGKTGGGHRFLDEMSLRPEQGR